MAQRCSVSHTTIGRPGAASSTNLNQSYDGSNDSPCVAPPALCLTHGAHGARTFGGRPAVWRKLGRLLGELGRGRFCRSRGRHARPRHLHQPLFRSRLSLARGVEGGARRAAALKRRVLRAQHARAPRRGQGDHPHRRAGRILRGKADERRHGRARGSAPQRRPDRRAHGGDRAAAAHHRRPQLRAARSRWRGLVTRRLRHRHPLPHCELHLCRVRSGVAQDAGGEPRSALARGRGERDGAALRRPLRDGRDHPAPVPPLPSAPISSRFPSASSSAATAR